MDIKEIQTIIQFLKANEITDFELNHPDGTKLKLARAGQPIMVAAPAMPAVHSAIVSAPVAASAPAADGKAAAAANSNLKKVESPIVGTFYRKPSPEAPAFVKEGDRVKKGQKLCIVEAMKVMNEIESPHEGVVERVLPSEGAVVEYGEVLFLINPAA